MWALGAEGRGKASEVGERCLGGWDPLGRDRQPGQADQLLDVSFATEEMRGSLLESDRKLGKNGDTGNQMSLPGKCPGSRW